jgi:hypothetical protein
VQIRGTTRLLLIDLMHKSGPSSAGGLPSLGLCSGATGGGPLLSLSSGGIASAPSSSVHYQGEIKDGKYHGSGTKIWPGTLYPLLLRLQLPSTHQARGVN